jgi:hypothetical protein
MQLATTNNAQLMGSAANIALPKSANGKPLRVRTGKNGAGDFLRSQGYSISDRFIETLCAPLVNEGPEPETRWGRHFLYSEETLLAWAEARGKRQLEDAKARAEMIRAARDAALERRAQREASAA